MRKSHIVFIVFCIAWVSFIMLNPDSSELIEETGYARSLGQAIGSLLIPGMVYGGYLLLTRNKSKTMKTSI